MGEAGTLPPGSPALSRARTRRSEKNDRASVESTVFSWQKSRSEDRRACGLFTAARSFPRTTLFLRLFRATVNGSLQPPSGSSTETSKAPPSGSHPFCGRKRDRASCVLEGMKKKKPYVSNFPALESWLKSIEAQCNWQLPLGDPEEPRAYVEHWRVPGSQTQLILIVDSNGWEVFTSFPGLGITETLADATARLAKGRAK